MQVCVWARRLFVVVNVTTVMSLFGATVAGQKYLILMIANCIQKLMPYPLAINYGQFWDGYRGWEKNKTKID